MVVVKTRSGSPPFRTDRVRADDMGGSTTPFRHRLHLKPARNQITFEHLAETFEVIHVGEIELGPFRSRPAHDQLHTRGSWLNVHTHRMRLAGEQPDALARTVRGHADATAGTRGDVVCASRGGTARNSWNGTWHSNLRRKLRKRL